MFFYSGWQEQNNKCTTQTLHFNKWFFIRLVHKIKIMVMKKYKIEADWPMTIYGCSTVWLPIHVKVNCLTNNQNNHWLSGQNIILGCLKEWRNGIILKIKGLEQVSPLVYLKLNIKLYRQIKNIILPWCAESYWVDLLEYNYQGFLADQERIVLLIRVRVLEYFCVVRMKRNYIYVRWNSCWVVGSCFL